VGPAASATGEGRLLRVDRAAEEEEEEHPSSLIGSAASGSPCWSGGACWGTGGGRRRDG